MHVTELTIHNIRNYTDLTFHPAPGVNVLIGKNAQGKTSVLEALYLLATGRSWRAGRDAELIHWGAEQARVFAKVTRERQNDIEVEITIGRTEKKQISVNTVRRAKLAEFLGNVNIVLIDPYDVDIIRGDPHMRRQFLNIEISQIQPQYCHLLVNYRKVLEQRNRFLRDLERKHPSEELLSVLNKQLADYGAKIMERRLAFIENIAEVASRLHADISEDREALEMKYLTSIDLEGTENRADRIQERINARMGELKQAEIQRGVTLVGPQRDNVAFTLNGVDAGTYGSQGQQRTIALSLRLAEIELMERASGESPIVLLDDVMIDLDEQRRVHVFQMTRQRCQTFVTAASRRSFSDDYLSAARVFQVSDGTVTPE